jgi:hypothetical protein
VSATDPAHDPKDDGEGALPRAVGTWRRAYALVIAVLAANVALLWLLGRIYG